MHRQAHQAHLIHVSGRLPDGGKLTVVRSVKPQRKGGRTYTPQQVRMVAAAQNARNRLSTLIAHPGERPPDRFPARPENFAGRPRRGYTVAGKGGLVRIVRIPDDLAYHLEERRLGEPVRITDCGAHYRPHGSSRELRSGRRRSVRTRATDAGEIATPGLRPADRCRIGGRAIHPLGT